MGWTLSRSVDEFLTAAGALLESQPAENTVLLTVSRRIARAGPTTGGVSVRFGWWRSDEQSPVGGAFLETPPYPVRLSVMPSIAAGELGATLAGSVRSVGGPTREVDAFVEGWTAMTGGTAVVRMNQLLYRLGTLVTPVVPGVARRSGDADRALLIRWFDEFTTELDLVRGDIAATIESRLAGGNNVWIWEDRSEPVAMAGASAVVAGMARVGPVYTPPDRRRRGYASAVTAAVSADAIARGAEQVLLYTDAANPTSNSVYQKLGFRPIGDDLTVDLAARP